MTGPSLNKRVLFVITLLDRMGGAEKNLMEIVLNLDRDEFIPHVLVFKGGQCSDELAARGIPVRENGMKKLFSLHSLREAFALRRFLIRERVDLVVTYHHDADIFAGLVAATARVPVISSRRDMGYQLEKKHVLFYRWLNWLFARFITVSDAVKAEIIRREGIRAEKITTIHNGLDLESVSRPDPERLDMLARELGLSPGKIIIGMVASFRPVKGQEYLVEAIAELKEWWDRIQVVIVGYKDTEYYRKVEARIKKLGLRDLFVCPGTRNDVPELLHLFDVFVISSLNEGFSNAIIEAMVAGLPVIAADSGGNREAVVDRKTGLLFPPQDSRALAEALDLLLNDRDLSIELGRNGKKRVADLFTRERMVAENEAVYRRYLRPSM